MAIKIEATKFIENLNQVAQVRSEMAQCLNQMVVILEEAESEGKNQSGQLGLERDIKDLNQASKNLCQGCFRILVLGDMKRGKSTFLNALVGKNILPSDVNPCTALLTILRYGKEPKVTVYFNDGQPPEVIDFKTFKRLYSIDPAEAKNLEREKKRAFPNVDHAVVEYPLALLEKGIEIVDSPGLNDTEARNELSLGYINNCHAILFVLRASQPCTLAERRYLENYIKDRGLSVFFLINAWDQVRESLIDPDDSEELQEAKKEFAKHLPQIAQDYSPPISEAIQECFDAYEQEVVKRIDDDIQARQAELDNLIQQKEQQQVNHEQELKRLTHFQSQVAATLNTIETIYQNFISSLA